MQVTTNKLSKGNAVQARAHLPAIQTVWGITLIACVAYIFLEWLFMVSKPSSMSAASTFQKATIPLFSIALFTLLACLIQTVIYFILKPFPHKQVWFSNLLMIIPAFIFSAAVLLLIDNLTYTALAVGIVTSSGLFRIVYAVGFSALVFFFIHDLDALSKNIDKWRIWNDPKLKTRTAIILAGVMSLTVTVVVIAGITQQLTTSFGGSGIQDRKNIVLITADGLNAQQMSVYGHANNTTPFLKQVASKALISQNNFSNSGNTAGSITSILTSKYPTKTRVLYRPDILRGEDCYQSLPAVLKSAGYYSAQYSIGFYADAYQLNFENAFDYVNGRTAESNNVLGITNFPAPTNYKYFLYELQNRLLPRLNHIFFVEIMQNEYQQITNPTDFNDQEKITQAINLLTDKTQPVFVHVHWLGTHGPQFHPRNRVFSIGEDVDKQVEWAIPFYEDAILDFDRSIELFFFEMEKAGILNNTVVIIAADHGMGFVTSRRTPLIMFFPNAEHSGELVVDTQNLDIGPTVLDYLGLSIPKWMAGQSLLKPLDVFRPIFGVRTKNTVGVEGLGWVLDEEYNKPPFYQFDYIGVENCGVWTQLRLEDNTWSDLNIEGYNNICMDKDKMSGTEIRGSIIYRLQQDGFEFEENQIPKIPSVK